MRLRVRTKPVFVFFGFATRGTHITRAAAAAAVTLAVARAATTPKTWPRSTPKIGDDRRCVARRLFFDDPKLHSFFGPTLFFLARLMLFWQLALFCRFSEQASCTSFNVQFCYNIFLANHSAVGQPHPTKGAELYCCCIQAGGILAATEVCCAGCTPLCAGRCARRLFVLLVVPFMLLI